MVLIKSVLTTFRARTHIMFVTAFYSVSLGNVK